MNDRTWTVYIHTNNINGKKYVGITSRDVKLRWQNGLGYKKCYFANAIQKYGWDNFSHEIVYENLSKEEAFLKEKELIEKYKTTDRRYGYNRSTGGEAPALGMHHSEETKKYLREIGKKKSYWKGKKIPREYVEKSLQTKIENGTILFGKDNVAHRSIYCIEYGEYLDIASDSEIYGVKDLSSVIKCCNGKMNSTYGLHFLYMEDVSYENIINKMNTNTDQHHKKLVRCIELNKIFDSTVDATNFLDVKPSTIISACNGRLKTAKGFTWEYIENKGDYMGTNFYFITQDREIKDKYFNYDDYTIVDTPMFGYEVHLAKTSCGWKPLWQDHSFYHSVAELKEFYFKHKEKLFLYDEYGRFYKWEEFEERVVNWGEQQEIRYMKYIPEGVPDEVFGGKKYLIESTKDDYDITIPFDHIEYDKLDVYRDNWRYEHKSYYSKDKDGYDFMQCEFS